MSDLHAKLVETIPRLRRYARALLRGDVLAADDLVQDCLERALSRLHSWRSDSDLRAWLFTIMHNIYVNQVRRAAAGPSFMAPSEQEEPVAASGTAEAGVALRDLQRALDALPADQREIVLLVSMEGLRYQEVAAILGIPEGTVMSRLSRARSQLREWMNQEQAPTLRRIK